MNTNRDVPIEVISRHDAVSERMKVYATEKAGKLLRFHNRISRIQVVVDEAHQEPSVEMIIHVDTGATLVTREKQAHFNRAIDMLVEKMERLLKRNNERRKHHKGNGMRTDTARGAEARREETYDDAVRRDLAG